MPNKIIYDIKTTTERLKNYCALQEKCSWDVKQKMNEWNVPKISQDHLLKIIIREKYVDEERYSRLFCRGKFKIKKWGRIKIKNELKKKYISDIHIAKGLKEIENSEYQNELNKQYQKKRDSIKEKNHFLKKKKIAISLINKGYESNLVWEKLRELKE